MQRRYHNGIRIILIMICLFGIRSVRVEAAEVPVSVSVFPDERFRSYILQELDKNKDGILSEEEIINTVKIVIEADKWNPDFVFMNFQGIEYFTELHELVIRGQYHAEGIDDCDMGMDVSLDVSSNLKLKHFFLEAGKIEKLDLSFLSGLEEVLLHSTVYENGYPVQNLRAMTGLKKVDVGKDVFLPEKMPELEKIHLRGQINPSIDFQYSPKLQEITLYDIIMDRLDLSLHSGLKKISMLSCQVPSVDLHQCTRLETVDLSGGNWTRKLNLKGCTKVKKLVAHGQFKELDVKEFVRLKHLDCEGQYLRELDLRHNHKLETVNASRCRLQKIHLSRRAKYKKLSIAYNRLTKLDLRKIKVKAVDCRNNRLRLLKARGNQMLKELYCQNNRLKTLDVSKCRNLKRFRR